MGRGAPIGPLLKDMLGARRWKQKVEECGSCRALPPLLVECLVSVEVSEWAASKTQRTIATKGTIRRSAQKTSAAAVSSSFIAIVEPGHSAPTTSQDLELCMS